MLNDYANQLPQRQEDVIKYEEKKHRKRNLLFGKRLNYFNYVFKIFSKTILNINKNTTCYLCTYKRGGCCDVEAKEENDVFAAAADHTQHYRVVPGYENRNITFCIFNLPVITGRNMCNT